MGTDRRAGGETESKEIENGAYTDFDAEAGVNDYHDARIEVCSSWHADLFADRGCILPGRGNDA